MEERAERTRRVEQREASPWLEKARTGDPVAFDRLVRPLLGNLLALSRRIAPTGLAEDLLQDALLRAFRGIGKFRGTTSFRSWLVSILFHRASDLRRNASNCHLGVKPLEAADWIADGMDKDPLQQVSARDILHRVEEAMERLPARQRMALHLRAVEGFSYAEIAQVLETSLGQCRNHVLLARRKLRERLGGLL